MDKRLLTLLLLTLFTTTLLVMGAPEGPTIVSNTTESPTPQSAASQTTAGGSFTTLILNATTQTLKWKAYVGNITGTLSLRDAQNFSIYDWDLTTITGEVYASRNNTIDWDSIRCANQTEITEEENHLNIATSAVDSINSTFNDTIHTSFFVGTTPISNSTCRSIATYVNDTAQTADENADFQLILLSDTQRRVYATILEDDVQGYNNGAFDFQMIVAEDPTTSVPSTYYFWAELG